MNSHKGSFSRIYSAETAAKAEVKIRGNLEKGWTIKSMTVRFNPMEGCTEMLIGYVRPSKAEPRQITEKERAKGRSENYHQMTAEEQWAEDKRLGILDWDGE